MDVSLILVLATVVTGGIWLLDAFVLRRRRLAGVAEGAPEETAKEPVIVEYARSFFPIVLLVLVVRSFLIEPFRIPSASMTPTLLVGDFIFVNKFSYGLRLPVSYTKVLDLGEPERGDVVVFRLPSDPSVNYIKRERTTCSFFFAISSSSSFSSSSFSSSFSSKLFLVLPFLGT